MKPCLMIYQDLNLDNAVDQVVIVKAEIVVAIDKAVTVITVVVAKFFYKI